MIGGRPDQPGSALEWLEMTGGMMGFWMMTVFSRNPSPLIVSRLKLSNNCSNNKLWEQHNQQRWLRMWQISRTSLLDVWAPLIGLNAAAEWYWLQLHGYGAKLSARLSAACNERHSDNWRNEVTFTFKMTIPTTCSLPVQRVNDIDWC